MMLAKFRNGEHKIEEWLADHPKLTMFQLTVAAMSEQNETALEWLNFAGGVFEDHSMLLYAAKHGHLDILERMKPWAENNFMHAFQPAVVSGNIETLDWLYSNTETYPTSVKMKRENQEVEQWLTERGIEIKKS